MNPHFLMNHLRCTLLLLPLLLAPRASASPAAALQVEKTYQLAVDQWALEMRIATTPEAQAKATSERPDATAFAKKMWLEIGDSLNDEWTLAPAAWFLKTTQGLITTRENGSTAATFAAETDAIRKAVEAHHLSSGKLAPICMAFVSQKDPRGLALLEKIEASHPDPKIRGIAALSIAMQLKSLADEPEVMKKRLNYLRKAIIQSSDLEVDGTTVAKLAEDELYVIRFLTKGRIAPDLTGLNASNQPLTLSSFKGKIVVLLFWSSTVQDADRVVEITTALNKKFQGRPFVIVGVNHDPLDKLRAMQADGTVTWQNFSDPEFALAKEYRVGSWPLVYVLDQDRKIQFAGSPGSFVELTAEALLAELK
jgi:peroxiredoxin